MNSEEELIDALAQEYEKADQLVPSREELTEAAGALVSFFEILIEQDRKLMNRHGQNNRNPDHSS
jgi:hypothetical protein